MSYRLIRDNKGDTRLDPSPFWADVATRERVLNELAQACEKFGKFDVVAGLEPGGGVMVALALAMKTNTPCVSIFRADSVDRSDAFNSNYVANAAGTVCIAKGSIQPNQRVLLADLALTTGEPIKTASDFVTTVLGAQVVGAAFLFEQEEQGGRHATGLSQIAVAFSSSAKEKEKQVEAKPDLENDYRVVVLFYSSMESVARSICEAFPTKFRLGSVTWAMFPDGWPNIKFEHMKFLEGRSVVFLGSMYERTKVLEQMSLLMVLPRQFVKSLDIIFPYFAPAQMERVEEEGILATAETVAKLITSSIPMTRSGPAALRIFDIHALTVRFYFPDTVVMRLMSAIPLLLQEIAGKNLVICFPDDGAAKRFKPVFSGFPIIVCAKVREGDKRVVRVADQINFTKNTVLEEVIIVDDLVQSGGTLNECRKVLVEYGAKKVSAYVTHAVFPNHGYKSFMEGGDKAGFNVFYTTDTIPEVASQLEGLKPFHVFKIGHYVANDILKLLRGLETHT